MRHRFPYAFWWAPPSLLQEYVLYRCTIFSHHTNYLENLKKRQRTNVAMHFINDSSVSSNKTKKPLQWNNLMLHLLLVDTLPILFRFLPKYLEISLVIVRKKLGLAKLTSVSSKENKQRLVKILLENILVYQVVKFISSLCCLIIPTT